MEKGVTTMVNAVRARIIYFSFWGCRKIKVRSSVPNNVIVVEKKILKIFSSGTYVHYHFYFNSSIFLEYFEGIFIFHGSSFI